MAFGPLEIENYFSLFDIHAVMLTHALRIGRIGRMEKEFFGSRGNVDPDQVQALFDFMYQVSVRLETVETLIRAQYSDEQYLQAYEQARRRFPSEAIFPEPAARESLRETLRRGTKPQAKSD